MQMNDDDGGRPTCGIQVTGHSWRRPVTA